MVGIVSGIRAGLELGSREVLGQPGLARFPGDKAGVGNTSEGRNGQGVYINVATGQLVVQNRDELLVARGDDAAVVRTYNSAGQLNDDNGDNWASGVQSLRLSGVVNTAGSTIVRVGRDGSAGTYNFDAGRGIYVTTEGAGAYDTLSFIAADNQFEWRDGSTGVTQRFEGSGAMRLLTCRDPSGNTLTYGYGANGFLSSVSTSAGETTFYDYAGNNLSQVRTVAGGLTSTRVRYAYDTSNRLASVTVDLSPADNVVADLNVYQTTYTYDGLSNRVATIAQSDGTSLAFTYVDLGAGNFKVASLRDALGQTTTFSYAAGATTVTDAQGQATRYETDAAGQLTRVLAPAALGTVAPSQQFAYNANGDVISVTDGAGRAVTFGYDANGNQVLQRDQAGNTVTRTFDARNQLLTETAYVVPDPDGAGLAQPSAPLTTRYVYDAAGRNQLRFVVDAEGRVTEHRYSAFGERIATVTYPAASYATAALAVSSAPSEADMTAWVALQNPASTQRAEMSYDARGQLQSRTTYASVSATGAGVADGTQSVESFVYDQAGLLLKTVSARGGVTTYTYDGLGRVLSTVNALGETSLAQYQDSAGKTVLTLASGLVRTSTYDKAGRLVSVAESNAGGAVLGETKYFYDSTNRLRMTQDPTGVRTWILYDQAGRKEAEVDGNGTMTEYTYDASDRLTYSVTYATGVNTALLVDLTGLPVTSARAATVRPLLTPGDGREWRSYDAAGRLLRVAHNIGTGTAVAVTENRYDGASRLVATVRYATALVADTPAVAPGAISAPAAAADDRTSRNFYDGAGLLAGALDAEGYLTVFGYSGAGQLAQATRYATATDPLLRTNGTLAQLTPLAAAGDARTVHLYDGKGQRVATVDAEGYLTESIYDNSGNVSATVRYANRVAVGVTPASTLAAIRPAASAQDRRTIRSFDALNRLQQETTPEGLRTLYTYDQAGNVVSSTKAAVTADETRSLLARYDLQGRLVAELSAQGAALLAVGQTQAQIDAIWAQYGQRYTYDAAGRRTSTTDAAGNRTLFYYDSDGALTHTVNALGEVTENRYDARGRLIEQYGYTGRISTVGLNGGLVSTAFTGAVAAIAASQTLTARYTYTSDDRLASVSDAFGKVSQSTYNAFGEQTASDEAIGSGLVLSRAYSVDHRGLPTGTTVDPANAYGLKAVSSTTYDAFGRAVRTVDKLGNARDQAFDRLGRVVTRRDALGAQRSTSYDAFDRVLTETDALGKVTTYAYDLGARTVTVTTPEGIRTSTAFTRHGQVQSITDGNGQVTTYTYDRDGRLVRTATPLTAATSTYDGAGRLLQTVDAGGTQVAYTYDAANRVLTRRVDPNGLNLATTYAYDGKGQQVSVTDPQGIVTTRQFDAKGQVLRETVDPTGLNLQTVYAYDARGNVLTVTSPAGSVTQYVYDAQGRRTQERVDPNGLNLTRKWAYDANGNVTSSTDALGNLTRYAYDAEDRLVFTVDPLGAVRQSAYDVAGRVVKTVAYAGTIGLGTLAANATTAQIQVLLAPPGPLDSVEQRVYDNDGRVVATVDGIGAAVRYAYDANGNVVARTAFANVISLATWIPGTLPLPLADPAHDATVRTVYDALNRAIYTVDGVGAVVAQTYDGSGRVLQRTAYATPIPVATAATAAAIAAAVGLVANPARDATLRNTYDAAGRLTWTVDGVGGVTQRVYDADGNVVRQVAYATAVAAGSAASTVLASTGDRITRMAYDAANRMVFQVDALGGVTEQAFDADGHVVRRTSYAKAIGAVGADQPGGAALVRAALVVDAGDRTTRYGFDAAGRQVLAIDAGSGVVETQYDAAGHVTATLSYFRAVSGPLADTSSLAAMKSLVSVDAQRDRVTRHAYDAAGERVFTVDAVGAVTGRQYDVMGRLLRTTRYAGFLTDPTLTTATSIAAALAGKTGQIDVFTYNAAGQLTSSTDAMNATESFTYDALGRKLAFTNKNGAQWTYEYDAAGRLLSETTPLVPIAWSKDLGGRLLAGADPNPNAAVVTRMAYDALGNLTQRTEAAGRGEERTTSYEYDALGRQVRVVYPSVGVYEGSLDDVTTNGAAGSALRMESTRPLETRTFYDALGNAVASTDVGGGVSQKAYDLLGGVAYEVDAEGYVTGYTRNAFGDATRLVRYAVKTSLANVVVTQSAQAVGKAQVDTALGALGVDHSADRALLFTYDRMGRVIEKTEPSVFVYDFSVAGSYSGLVGKTTRNAYNSFGDLIQVNVLRNPAANTWVSTTHYFDRAGHETGTVDAMGYVTQREFDAVGNVTKVIEYANAIAAGTWSTDGYAIPTAGEDRITRYSYDALNRKTAETRDQMQWGNSSGAVFSGSLVTSYGYDAVGNQTYVTDATGATTYTNYDALGRVRAVAAPRRAGADGVTQVTPFTLFWRDAHGNLIATRAYVNGAATANASAATPGAESAEDRITVTQYDKLGRAIAAMDANAAVVYSSFDAYGHVAKSWQDVSGNANLTWTNFEVSRYDKLGQLVEKRTPASTSVFANGAVSFVTQAQAGLVFTGYEYNAFGEMTRRGTQGGRQEFFDYDNAGRLWRTNADDGLYRINLYNALGNLTSEIRNAGSGRTDVSVDIRAFTDAQSAAFSGGTRRVDKEYDALGRVTATREPERLEQQDGVRSQRQWFTVGATSGYMSGFQYINQVQLNWGSLVGTGDILVWMAYRAPSGAQYSYTSPVLEGDRNVAGTTLAFAQPSGDNGVSSVVWLAVYKKDKYGNWQKVIDQAPGTGPVEMVLPAPPDPSYVVDLQIRVAGSPPDVGWSSAPLLAFSGTYLFRGTSLAPGNYEYRYYVARPGEARRDTAHGILAVPYDGVGWPAQYTWWNGESAWLRPTVYRKNDRWGNVVEITDPRAAFWKTTYKYNANNQMVQQVLPDAGSGTATTSIYYDAVGRQVATRDARGSVNGQVYDAGGNLTQELHADGGVVTHSYSAFGDRVRTVSAEGRQVLFTYDQLGRMIAMNKGVADVWHYIPNAAEWIAKTSIVDKWGYDQLGRKLWQQNGNGEFVAYRYDLAGNLVETTQHIGQKVQAAYDAQGHKVAERDANLLVRSWVLDYFGRVSSHVDLMSLVQYDYDNAGQLTWQHSSRGQSISYSYDAAGQVTTIQDWADSKQTFYVYDLAGRKVRERTWQAGSFYQDNHLAYDARGNLRDVADARAHVLMEYDQVGNRTRQTTFVGYQGKSGETSAYKDGYFQFDAMNRQTKADAVDAFGNIGHQGHVLGYDKDGNRTSDMYWGKKAVQNAIGAWSATDDYTAESYVYDALNRMCVVFKDGTRIDSRGYDAADRVIITGTGGSLLQSYSNAINQGLTPDQMNGNETRVYRYNQNGWLMHEVVYKSDGTLKASLSWDPNEVMTYGTSSFTAAGYDAAGNSYGYVLINNEAGFINRYTIGYDRFENYVPNVTQGVSSKLQPGASYQTYDNNGFLISIADSTQPANNRSFVNDASGKALFVNQAGNLERQLVVNGEVLGQYGVRVNPSDPVQGANNNPNFSEIADFNFTFSKITGSNPTPSPAGYVVQAGDTLQSIARAAYGDSAMWFRIAEANGLTSKGDMRVGQTLTIPNRVATTNNNNTTFKPYDPSKIQGETTPNMAMPPAKKASFLKQLITVIVAIVAAYFGGVWFLQAFGSEAAATAAAATATTTTATTAAAATATTWSTPSLMAAGAFGEAAGSAASQVAGLALGTQNRFSWKAVALSALQGGISAGIGGLYGQGGIQFTSDTVSNRAIQAALSNLVTQGVGVVTGLQKAFDWKQVAASAVGAGLGEIAGQALGFTPGGGRPPGMGPGEFIMKASARAFVAGAAAAVTRGGRVVVQQIAADAFGNALGQSIAEKIPGMWNRTMATGSAPAAEGSQYGSGLEVSETLYESWGPKFVVPDPLIKQTRDLYVDGTPRLSAYQSAYGDDLAVSMPVEDRESYVVGRPLAPLPPIPRRLNAEPSFGQYNIGVLTQAFDDVYSNLDRMGENPATSNGMRFAAAMVRNPAKWVGDTVAGTTALLTYGLDLQFRSQVNAALINFLGNDPVGTSKAGITRYWDEHSGLEITRDALNLAAGALIGTPIAKSAGLMLGETASLIGEAGETALRWTQRVSEYHLEWTRPTSSGFFSFAGAVDPTPLIPVVRNLRADVNALLPEGFELARISRGAAAVLRYGEDYYSVPKGQYSLIPELRIMDTMGDVFSRRVQTIADRFNPLTDLTEAQALRLRVTPEGWLRNRFMSAYKGSYVDKQFGRELPDIWGGSDYAKMAVGPDVVPLTRAGLSYEITQATPSLNAIYSHTRKYPGELLRYVTYK